MTASTRPATRTATGRTIIATSHGRTIRWALVVGFKPYSNSRFRTRIILCHQKWKKMRTQQTSNMNRLNFESAKHTCQAMADGKTKTETLHASRDLKSPADLYPDSQPCMRNTFSASFVPQPAENHTYCI